MADYITTYTGIRMVPTEPKAEDICIEDIAHALSYICRGNGHVRSFFSVGQHSIHCAAEAKARGYSNRICLACLLHDASEAYMQDVTSPVKKYLSEYRKYEDRLLAVIYEKYLKEPVSQEEWELVKAVDDDMLYYDLKVLLHEIQDREEPEMKSRFSYEVLPFETVEKRFLEFFYQLTEK